MGARKTQHMRSPDVSVNGHAFASSAVSWGGTAPGATTCLMTELIAVGGVVIDAANVVSAAVIFP
jgi:hypothetical protein